MNQTTVSSGGLLARLTQPASRAGLLLLAGVAALCTGCSPHEIHVYSIPKEKEAPIRTAEAPRGPQEIPKWKAPANWKEGAGGRMSLASFSITGENGASAEVAVFPFQGRGAPDIEFLNIWRERLGLNRLTEESLPSVTESIQIGGAPAKLYNVGGALAEGQEAPKDKILVAVQSRSGTTWFYKIQGESGLVDNERTPFINFLRDIDFQGVDPQTTMAGGDPHAGMSMGGAGMGGGSGAPGQALPAWELPSGWQQQPTPQMLLAKFLAKGEADSTAEITVSSLAGTGGGLLMNINRWRGQLGLAPISEGDLSKAHSLMQVLGKNATLVELSGTDQKSGNPANLVVVIVPHAGQSWFFKMMGDVKTFDSHKPAFLKFVQSIRFPDA